MNKVLQMVFKDAGGKDFTLAVADPKDGLSKDQVETVMQDIITKNVFASKQGALVKIAEARIVSRETAKLA